VFFSSPQAVILQIETTERTPETFPRPPQVVILQVETTERTPEALSVSAEVLGRAVEVLNCDVDELAGRCVHSRSRRPGK
jgi:hypothetical protein